MVELVLEPGWGDDLIGSVPRLAQIGEDGAGVKKIVGTMRDRRR